MKNRYRTGKFLALIVLSIIWLNGISQTIEKFSFQNDSLKFQVTHTGTVYTSSISRKGIGDGSFQDIVNIQIDTSINGYRTKVDSILIVNAQSLVGVYSATQITFFNTAFQSWASKLDTTLTTAQFENEEYEHWYFHNSILKILMRQIVTRTCECEEYKGYIVNKAVFQCEQDIIVSITDLLSFATDSLAKLTNTTAGQNFYNYLHAETMTHVSFHEMKIRFNQIYNADSSGLRMALPLCFWLQGTDCGCCGNYSGVCWYCSMLCFYHDYACWKSKCKPRALCFRGCQTTPCW